MVADIMKSLSIYDIEVKRGPNHKIEITPKLLCRDPRGQWCLDSIKVTSNMYLMADFKMNLVML